MRKKKGFKPHKPRTAIAGPYRSKVEERVAKWLDTLPLQWEYEGANVTYEVPAIWRTYTPDFTIEGKHHDIHVEVKGRLDLKEERDKLLQIKASNPGLDLRVLCPYDRKVYRNKRCSDWLFENNFRYFIGECPPLEWFT